MPAPTIAVCDQQRRYQADPRRIRALVRSVLLAEGAGERRVSIALVNDREIARAHVEFLGVAGPTDVVSFPLEDELDDLLGEVVVSTDTAAREAKARGLSLEEEVLRYVVHGTLHLLGYDDHAKADYVAMHARQELLLAAFLAGRRRARAASATTSPRRSAARPSRTRSKRPPASSGSAPPRGPRGSAGARGRGSPRG